ncbi:RPA family protein [Halolamina litorea]|uniref:Rpa-associated protein n=1 Tax=Halolamina litorea TaxID=1515593 RepID=A0ABD6BS95_9EURY
MSADSGPGNREIARRLFAAEFDDASLSYSESDEERAPNYVVTPTGARVNRLFAVGVLTEVEAVNEDSLRGRVVDPTGAFVTYAGQYQPDEHAFLSRTEPPTFVALSGKARTFEPEDSDRVFTSVRPESINEVDADTRDRWVVSAAERTLHRIAVFAEALDSDLRGEELTEALVAAGVDPSLATGVPKAIEHYGTGTAYLEAVRSLAVQAVEQVAGDRDSVDSLTTEPAAEAPAELGALPDVGLDLGGVAPAAEEPAEDEAMGGEESTDDTEQEPDKPGVEPGPTASEAAEGEPTAPPEEPSESEAEPETAEPEPEPEPATTEASAEDTDEADADTEPEAVDEPADESDAEPEPTSEPEDDLGDDDLGDFDAGDSVQETVDETEEELDDFDPEATMDDTDDALTESERQEVEEEFGTEFSTGSEVGDPGEAGIDVPTSEEELEEIEAEVTGEEPGETDEEPEEKETADVDVDLEAAAVEAMAELDDGDGADHDAVVAHVVYEHAADAGAVEDAIQDAMMSGKCYEPGDGTLKAI